MAKHLFAIHPHVADRPRGRGAAIDVKDIALTSIGMQMRRQNAKITGAAVALMAFQYHRAGPVTEQNAG